MSETDERPEVACVLDYTDADRSGLYGPFPSWRVADAYARFLVGNGSASWTCIPLIDPTKQGGPS